MSNPRPLCVVTIPLERELEQRIEAVAELARLDAGAEPGAELLEALRGASGLLCSNRLRVDETIFAVAPALRVVAGHGVGYDRFDLASAERRGIVVTHTPGVLTECVTNLVMAMMLAFSRRVVVHDSYVRSGEWSRGETRPPLGFDLRGRTLGVIGFGRIGRSVTERAQTFGMRTLWNDLFEDLPEGAPRSAYRSLPDLLAESDVVTLHTDLNPTSHHLIGAPELERMRPDALLVNTARGPVVDQAALAKALCTGRIAGAALDVLETEPPPADDPILSAPNTILTPHAGSGTSEARYAMRELAARNVVAVLSGEPPPTPVSADVAGTRAGR